MKYKPLLNNSLHMISFMSSIFLVSIFSSSDKYLLEIFSSIFSSSSIVLGLLFPSKESFDSNKKSIFSDNSPCKGVLFSITFKHSSGYLT